MMHYWFVIRQEIQHKIIYIIILLLFICKKGLQYIKQDTDPCQGVEVPELTQGIIFTYV